MLDFEKSKFWQIYVNIRGCLWSMKMVNFLRSFEWCQKLITLIFTFDQLSLVVTTKKQFPLSSASKSAMSQSVVVWSVVVGSSVVVTFAKVVGSAVVVGSASRSEMWSSRLIPVLFLILRKIINDMITCGGPWGCGVSYDNSGGVTSDAFSGLSCALSSHICQSGGLRCGGGLCF